MMLNQKYDCLRALAHLGFTYDDATALRRISMTLHRWHELECGDSNGYSSWTIARGHKKVTSGFVYDEDGKPYLERHYYPQTVGQPGQRITYSPLADRERGALKRLAAIMARYPGFAFYVQGDPRGCALYIMTPGQMASREPGWLEANYSQGIAVCK